ncbi:MAG: class I SAM-dependent methyltransferase [Betaproteobacteria bacterium]
MSDAEKKMFAMGAGYERFMGRWSRILARAHVAFAGVKDGERVLDVGAGTGALASAVAAVNKKGEVVGIDPSEALIAHARNAFGSEQVRLEVGDAQELQFNDAAFDKTLALLVMNFIPDHNKAIAEMRRVTRPQGVISACVWDYSEGMQMLRFFWDEVVALDLAMDAKDERHMKLSRQGQLAELWKKAGLVNVEEQPLVIDQPYTSFDDYWQPFLAGAGPAGAHAASLSEDGRKELETRLRKRLLGDRADGSFVLKAQAWCVRGEVPGK